MPTLLIRFPARRYHATPWGHHVNEGLIEWPPSPWRLLRALLAAGYTSGLWSGDGPPPIACALIEKLAGVLPVYRLPPAAGAHSRHFMPLARFRKGREDTTLVFDTWAQVDSGVLSVTWDVDLAREESTLLSWLAERLGYLGRSESWIEARLAQPQEPLPEGDECFASDAPPPPGWEQVSLMAAQTKEAYSEWREQAVEPVLSALPAVDATKKKLTGEDKKALAQREKAMAAYPEDLISCLQKETSWLRRHGWSQPPGSRRVFYRRRAEALEAGAPRLRPTKVEASPVEAMLLSMATESGNDHALPSVVRTLPQAELLHRALVSIATRGDKDHCPVLTGCDEKGNPLQGRHEHAHILPLDLDDDDHLDHFLVWASMGLDGTAQAAVRLVRRTFTKGGIAPLRLALAGAGSLDDLSTLPGKYGDSLRRMLGPPDGSTKWRSLTPFVPPRYMKKRGRNTLEGQVMAELASRGFPAPGRIQIIDPKTDAGVLRQRHFVRSRRQGPQPPVDCGFSIEIAFSDPVKGPICLGCGSHFGLGLFGVAD